MNRTQHLHRSAEGERRPEPPSLMRVEAILRGAGMPSDEIRTVMTTAEPELIHRYLELHLERLEEWLVDQRVSLATAERLLTLPRRPPDPTPISAAPGRRMSRTEGSLRLTGEALSPGGQDGRRIVMAGDRTGPTPDA